MKNLLIVVGVVVSVGGAFILGQQSTIRAHDIQTLEENALLFSLSNYFYGCVDAHHFLCKDMKKRSGDCDLLRYTENCRQRTGRQKKDLADIYNHSIWEKPRTSENAKK